MKRFRLAIALLFCVFLQFTYADSVSTLNASQVTFSNLRAD